MKYFADYSRNSGRLRVTVYSVDESELRYESYRVRDGSGQFLQYLPQHAAFDTKEEALAALFNRVGLHYRKRDEEARSAACSSICQLVAHVGSNRRRNGYRLRREDEHDRPWIQRLMAEVKSDLVFDHHRTPMGAVLLEMELSSAIGDPISGN